VDSLEVKAGEIRSAAAFQQFALPLAEGVGDTIWPHYPRASTNDFLSVCYKLYWTKKCDLWVDYIESMDMWRGYPFFWSPVWHQQKLDSIVAQADSVQKVCGNTLLGFFQADVPRRMMFTAHGAVNEALRKQGLKPSLASFAYDNDRTRRMDHFIAIGEPEIVTFFEYPFKLSGSLGNQTEIDTLAARLERTSQACQDTLDWRFIGQAFRDTSRNELDRNPTASEITVQAYMALAHGAKGLDYYCYESHPPINGFYWLAGLVDTSGAHTDTPFVAKWQAVHDVFAQVDSLGNTFLSLTLVHAGCAKDGGFQSPVTGISFSESDTAYVEFGQFTLSGSDYLILVNRRTDAERHVTVKTNKTGAWALRDLYTQEKFVSSTGHFEHIPFDSGQGRVFKLEAVPR
jgi:hypothetical protein